MFLFVRFLPMISIFEMRALLQTTKEEQPVRAGSVSDGPQPAQTGSISDGPEPAQTGSVSEGPQPARTGSVSDGPLQAVAHASGWIDQVMVCWPSLTIRRHW